MTCTDISHDHLEDTIARLVERELNLQRANELLVEALRGVIKSHCPDDRMYCGACSPARKLIAEMGAS